MATKISPIDNKEITVVVQGPVQTLPDRDMDQGITRRCLDSVRAHLPGCHLILSTWPDQDLGGLDYDELIICEDPGPNIDMYNAKGKPHVENMNRQIVTTREGLRRVTTPYAMKLRSDNFLVGDQFKHLQQAFPKRCDTHCFLKERVVVNNTFTRQYAKGMRVVFHSCDFFYFGLTQDLLALWDLPLFPDLPRDPNRLGRAQHPSTPRFIPDVTQRLWLAALERFDPALGIDHLTHANGPLKKASDICYANNLIVAEPQAIGLGLCSKFSGKRRANKLSSRITYLSFFEWKCLYQTHCDPGFKVANKLKGKLRLTLLRCLFLPGKTLEGRVRLLKYILANR